MADEKGKGKSPEEEIAQYQDILAKDPTSRVFARLAEAHRKAGQLDYAISVSREGLKNHPGYTAGQVVLARSLFNRGKSAEAREEISQVVAAAPDNLTAQKLLAQIAVRLSDRAAAEKAYRMVQLLDPSDEEAQNYLGAAEVEAPAMAPPSAYEIAPIESAPSPPDAPGTEVDAAGARAKEEGLPPGLTFEDEQEPVPEEPAAEAEADPPGEGVAPVPTEEVFDLGEMEVATEEETPEPEASADDSPFEIFTKEPRHERLPPGAREEKSAPFAEIELPGDDASDVEPAMEEPAAVIEEMPFGEAEEVTELVIDDVEPDMKEPLPEVPGTSAEAEPPVTEVEEATQLVMEEPAESLDAFDVEVAEDRRAGGDPSPEGVFNTETLANLYVTQGFYGKAADVYRQMLTDRPGDTNLRQKLEEVLALEKMQAPSVHEEPVAVAAEAPRKEGIGTESPVIEELQRLLTKLKERPR